LNLARDLHHRWLIQAKGKLPGREPNSGSGWPETRSELKGAVRPCFSQLQTEATGSPFQDHAAYNCLAIKPEIKGSTKQNWRYYLWVYERDREGRTPKAAWIDDFKNSGPWGRLVHPVVKVVEFT